MTHSRCEITVQPWKTDVKNSAASMCQATPNIWVVDWTLWAKLQNS